MNTSLISLENINLTSGKQRLTSPRSIEALDRLGIDLDELYFIDFKNYKLKHVEAMNLPDHIQQSRYDYYEKHRQHKLEEVLKERENINNDKIFMDKVSKSQIALVTSGNEKDTSALPITVSTSTAINNEIKAFERIKKKQEMELVTMIQNEFMAELQKKENEDKIQKQLEKQELLIKIKEDKRKAEAERQLQIQKDKLEKEREEEVERKRNDMKKYMKEQKFMQEQIEKQKQNDIQLKLKKEKEARQQELLRQRTEAIFSNQQKLLESKQKIMEERDEERKEFQHKKRLMQLASNREKQEKQNQIIQLTMKNLEEKLHHQTMVFNEKQNKKEERLRHYEYLRDVAFKEGKEKSMKKAEEISKVIEKNREKEERKVDIYNQKQAEIAKRQILIDEENRIEMQKKIEFNRKQEQKIQDVIKHNETLDEERRNSIVFKIQKTDKIKNHINMIKEQKNMEKCEESVIKQNEKSEIVHRISKIQEYKLRKVKERLDEKASYVEDFKNQKSILAEKRNEMKSEVQKKKEEYLVKFNELMKKYQIKDITVEILGELFPGNTEITKMFEDMKSGLLAGKKSKSTFSTSKIENESKINKIDKDNKNRTLRNDTFSSNISIGPHTTQNKNKNNNTLSMPKLETLKTTESKQSFKKTQQTSNNFKSHTNINLNTLNTLNSVNSVNPGVRLNQSDIDRKVNNYKVQLNDELLKIIKTEREVEQEREKVIAGISNSEEKGRVLKSFGIERAQASAKIVKFNRDIEKKVKDYEKSLYRTSV